MAIWPSGGRGGPPYQGSSNNTCIFQDGFGLRHPLGTQERTIRECIHELHNHEYRPKPRGVYGLEEIPVYAMNPIIQRFHQQLEAIPQEVAAANTNATLVYAEAKPLEGPFRRATKVWKLRQI